MELPFEGEIFSTLGENTVGAGINADNLAERIAKTNELVQKIKSLETENEKYLNNAYELGQSVQGIKALYDEERSKAESLQSKNDQLHKEILSIKTELANKERELNTSNLAHEQSLAESVEARKRDAKTYLDLCESVALAFINQANLLNDNGLLDKQAHRKVSGIWKNLTEHNLTLPVLKHYKKVSKKEPVTVAEKCIKVSSMDVAVECNLLPRPEPQKQMVTRATQYVTSTTTRAASTSAFIKTRTTGTNFPEPLAVTVEEALKATVFDLPKPISPINEINFPVARCAGTQTEIFSNKTVGTCTKVRNIRKTARQLFDSDFLVPIKKESPMNSMENLSYTPLVDMKAGGNVLPVSVQLMDLWNMLGQRLFSAMRNGSALHEEQLHAVNERIDMLHLHLQMEILNCLNLITTENNFCMDNYLLGSMGESHRKRKLSDSSEASFTADQFEPKRKSREECTSYDSERCLGDNLFTSANGSNSEAYELHHNDRVGDQAVREFFSMGKPSTLLKEESSVLCPDILNNFRKSVITRTKEVQNSKGGSVDTLSSPLEDTSMLNQSNEDTEVISDMVEEISKMADLSNINELVEAPVQKVSSDIDVEKIILEAKDPTDLLNKHNKSLAQVAQDSTCEISKPLEVKEVANMQENKCKEVPESTATCKSMEITAVDWVLKMFSSSSTKRANIKLKRLKHIKLAKKKLIDKQTFKSHEKENCGLKNLEETVVDLLESPSKARVPENDDVEDRITLTSQTLLKKNSNENSVFYTDPSRCSKNESRAKINISKNRNSENYIHQISCRVERKSNLIGSDIQDYSVASEEFSSSDTDEMEKIFQKYIVNISPISRLSESCSESEDYVQIENTYYNSDLQRTEKAGIGVIEAESLIHNNWEEHETPQSPPRNEIEDFSFAVAIPLERIPEHDFDYSPQSPKSEINYAVVPKTVIIPENNTIRTKSKKSLIGRKVNSVLGKLLDNFEEAKYTCLMRRKVLVEPPQDSKDLIKVRQILEHYIMKSALSEDVGKCTLRLLKRTKKKEIICTAIIEVIEDTDSGICNIQTPPAPPMTETHKKIVLLVHKLNLYFKEFSHTLLSLLEQRLFNFKEDKLSLEIAINYTLLYIGIIDINDCNKNPARLFIYKCLYYHNKKAVPMIYHILVSYPHILPKQSNPHYDRSDALISTVQCILNSLIYNIEKKDLKHREVYHILRLYYEYERVKPSKEEVVENLMAKIKAGKLENVSFSFALLCKHFGIEWAEREIVTKCLLPALTECYNLVLHSDCYDSQAAVLLESLSFVLKPFPLNSTITRYQQIFTNFLYATNRKAIQDAAVCAILRTQRFSYVDCFNSICNWKPNYNLDKNVRAMLKSFMYRKPFKFWRKVINQI